MKPESLRVKQWRENNRKLCPDCEEVYIHKESATCRKCAVARRSVLSQEMTLGEARNAISVMGKHPSWLHARVRVLCRSWNKDMLSKACANKACSYDKHVELCHIRDLSSLDDSVTLGEANDKNNVIQLCRNCHWEFDSGILSIDDLDIP